MPRPRTITNEEILQATGRVVSRLGPLTFTLADVASALGVTPAAILRRFETKRGLLLALVEASVADVGSRFAKAREREPSPLAALVAAFAASARDARSRAEIANSLAFLQIDLTDPAFHRLTLRYFDETRSATIRLIEEARELGELKRDVDPATLAAAVEVAWNGSLIAWAVRGEGSAEEATRRDLETVLEPYRARTEPFGGAVRDATKRLG